MSKPKSTQEAKQAMIPTEQRQVQFYEDEVTAVRLDDGQILVPIAPICDQLGITWPSQLNRINRDPVLSQVKLSIFITNKESKRGGRTMLCLPLQYLNGWLFGITASRVKEEIRDRLIRYQRDCYQVLYEAMQDGRLIINPDFQLSDDVVANATEALQIARAIAKLAHNQLVMESQQRRNVAQLADHAKRIEALETAVSAPGRVISNKQAQQVSSSVKAVALIMSKQTKTNQYGAVYGELYRRYGITEYKLLPVSKFEDCME